MELPKFIDIELNTSCNLECEPCPYKETHNKPEFMKLYLLEDILDQIDWECSIKLCQRGEPLLSSILIEAIKRIKKKGLKVVINTNGFYLNHMAKDLIKSGLDEIFLSDYNYPQQFQNACMFVALNQLYGSSLKLTVKTNNPQIWEGVAHNIIPPIYYNYSDISQDSTELPNWKCEQLFEKLVIEPNGEVRCCCGTIDKQKYVGSVRNTPLKDIWNSLTLFLFRRYHLNGESHKISMCRKCAYRKSFIGKNLKIEKTINLDKE